jgi:hypothetical protein
MVVTDGPASQSVSRVGSNRARILKSAQQTQWAHPSGPRRSSARWLCWIRRLRRESGGAPRCRRARAGRRARATCCERGLGRGLRGDGGLLEQEWTWPAGTTKKSPNFSRIQASKENSAYNTQKLPADLQMHPNVLRQVHRRNPARCILENLKVQHELAEVLQVDIPIWSFWCGSDRTIVLQNRKLFVFTNKPAFPVYIMERRTSPFVT